MKTNNKVDCGDVTISSGLFHKLLSSLQVGLLGVVAALGMSTAQGQQHILYYDPNETGGATLGGSGFWYQGAPGNWSPWWNGAADTSWDGNSSVSFQGIPGTLTLEAEVDCGPNSEDASPSLNVHNNFTINLNGQNLNFNDQWGEIGIFIDSGVALNIVGVQSQVRATILNWPGTDGLVVFGDGSALPYSQFGVGVIRGDAQINNDASGAGAFGWYTAIQGGTVTGTGNLSDVGVETDINNHGSISPGGRNGTGTLICKGGPVVELDNTPLLSFNLGGLNQGAMTNGYSWLKVNGAVTLNMQYAPASTIGLKLVNGFVPSPGNFFDVITCQGFLFTAGAGGSGLADLTYQLPIIPGGAWSASIVTNAGLQSLRFTVVPGPLLAVPPSPLTYLNFNYNLNDQTGNGDNGVFVSANANYGTNVPNATAGSASLSVPGDNSTAVSLLNTAGISEDDAQSFTLSLWFKISNCADYPSFVTCSNPNGSAPVDYYGWLGVDPAGNLTYGVLDIFNLSSSAFVADGNWHHAVLVHDGSASSYQLYVDGQPDGFTHATGTDQGGNLWNVTIGNGFLAPGNIDEVAYWDQALTAQQVATVYYLGAVPGAPTLSISSTSSNHVALSWLLDGYTLQENSNLTNPMGWTDLGTSPMSMPVGSGMTLFRLKK